MTKAERDKILDQVLTRINIALHTRSAYEREQKLREAAEKLREMLRNEPAQPGVWTCPYDGKPCADACALTAGLHGRCGRAAAPAYPVAQMGPG